MKGESFFQLLQSRFHDLRHFWNFSRLIECGKEAATIVFFFIAIHVDPYFPELANCWKKLEQETPKAD